ncbi:MAG: adenosylmethionine--8-amino-7-oxononanoate transaminase [Gammaproteobacteria bacterium]|nr:MAG: adenosylmethionine--8-amino-7-oxononanoate transaminase [Gammaproteobacteria bacterium]
MDESCASRPEERLLRFDREHLWHPYGSMTDPIPVWPVREAEGVHLVLEDGRRLIDGMASWWAVIHGYRHPRLVAALREQAGRLSHVMFGGLTHGPAVALGERLVRLTPEPLQHVFFADSGSVAVEVAMKMALQYRIARGESRRRRFLALRHGYHGDTFAAMSVCDPEGGMHHLFTGFLPHQYFAPAPRCRPGEDPTQDLAAFREVLLAHGEEITAVILEPVVQGAGGMRFYSPDYLAGVRRLCDRHGVLLIADEIATGFGRTGTLFACEQAGIAPDLLCVGKALTGGMLTLAATLCTTEVAATISRGEPGLFMHGPTFMANPLACRVACESIDLLLEGDWKARVRRIAQGLEAGLAPCRALPGVRDVRVLGAIGVVELDHPVDMHVLPGRFVERGVWVRPFRNLVYVMPPFVMEDDDLERLTAAICEVVALEAHASSSQRESKPA